jgi:hypothetical protein
VVRISPDGWVTLLPSLHTDGKKIIRKTTPSDQPITDRYGAIVGYETLLSASSDPANYLQQANFPTNVTVDGLADLVGYSLDSPKEISPTHHLEPGSSFWITTFWRAHGEAREEYDLVVRLVDDAGRQWAQADGPPLEGAYPTSMWQPGEKVADARLLWMDPKALPGRYWLTVALYDYLTDSRLPVSGGLTPDTIYLGPLKVPLPPLSEIPNGTQPQSADFGDVVHLLGYQLSNEPNESTLTLYWQARAPDGVDYTVFVHVLDETGQMLMGQDNQPVNGTYPTGIWEPGELVSDKHILNTSDLPPGKYQLEIGVYELSTGERLPVYLPDGKQDPTRRLLLAAPIDVQ